MIGSIYCILVISLPLLNSYTYYIVSVSVYMFLLLHKLHNYVYAYFFCSITLVYCARI